MQSRAGRLGWLVTRGHKGRKVLALSVIAALGVGQIPGALATAGAVVSVPAVVGKATVFGGNNGTNTTAIPTGTATGDVLVSTVESYPFTTITCPAGWTQAWDVTNGPSVRVASCVGVVGTSVPKSVHIGVSPPTQVSIVTQAFSGVNTSDPIDVANATTSLSPEAATAAAGDLLVFAEGSAVWQGTARAPIGSTLGATVNDSGNSQLAQATEAFPTGGTTPVARWVLVPSSSTAVSGVIALASATRSTTPPPTSGQPDPPPPAAQIINFTSSVPASPTVGGTYQVTATGGASGNPVLFSIGRPSGTKACSVSNSTVKFLTAGRCVIDANQGASASFAAATQVQQALTIVAAGLPQVINFTSSVPASPTIGGTYQVAATGGASGNPVVLSIDASSTPNACSVSSSTVQFLAVGRCVIDANQAGSASFVAATQVQQSLTVVAPPPTPSPPSSPPGSGSGNAPRSPSVLVCGVSSLLTGPATAPAGAVVVPAGDNSSLQPQPSTTYWFAPGTHTLGTGQYSQIIPANGDVFIGGPGAVLDGEGVNDYAFTQHATNVTIEYLTVQDFMAPNNEGVVNHDSGTGWIIEHDTIQNNPVGAGMMIGSNDVVEFNCLTHNGQYGFNAYSANGVANIVVSDNEISYNDTFGYDTTSGDDCGCAGGGKFWETVGATVTDNYVHDNQDPGLWVDTDNAGFNISDNYIARNSAEGLIYEISYNALISDNTFVDNAWGKGPNQGVGFPTTALYISESGSDPRVNSAYNGAFNVVGNDFIDNWGGVVLWENANRFCSDGYDNACTLVSPGTFSISSCGANLSSSNASQTPDYYDGCRWKTQNVNVSDNTFRLTASNVPGCTATKGCGYNGVFSEYGSTTPFQGTAVEDHITYDQNNHFSQNTYIGPWSFMVHEQGTIVSWAQWQGGPYNEDSGSTLSS
jgi:hypothetical protein